MRFGDVVTCVASLAVIYVLIAVPLGMVLVPAVGVDWGPTVNGAISILLSALIGGYIFAECIWKEARMKAIAKITVLVAVLAMFSVMMEYATFGDWTPWVKEKYLEANPTATLSTSEWMIVESGWLGQAIFINVVMVLVLGFIGLYVGSMLRRPSGK